MEMLESLGIEDRARSLPATLSGGEAQRVAIGRALITDPKLSSQMSQRVLLIQSQVVVSLTYSVNSMRNVE